MWDRDSVQWDGVRGNPGRLMGRGPINDGKAKKDQKNVDFREQIGVYILYSSEHAIYVGQTQSRKDPLFSRLKKHRVDHLADRWDKFSWFGLRIVNKDGTLSKKKGDLKRIIKASTVLNMVEGLLINVIEPPLNRQGARWSGIEQYVQLPEGWSAWSDRDLLIEIAEKLKIKP